MDLMNSCILYVTVLLLYYLRSFSNCPSCPLEAHQADFLICPDYFMSIFLLQTECSRLILNIFLPQFGITCFLKS